MCGTSQHDSMCGFRWGPTHDSDQPHLVNLMDKKKHKINKKKLMVM